MLPYDPIVEQHLTESRYISRGGKQAAGRHRVTLTTAERILQLADLRFFQIILVFVRLVCFRQSLELFLAWPISGVGHP
jgi:hypothetical protein